LVAAGKVFRIQFILACWSSAFFFK